MAFSEFFFVFFYVFSLWGEIVLREFFRVCPFASVKRCAVYMNHRWKQDKTISKVARDGWCEHFSGKVKV